MAMSVVKDHGFKLLSHPLATTTTTTTAINSSTTSSNHQSLVSQVLLEGSRSRSWTVMISPDRQTTTTTNKLDLDFPSTETPTSNETETPTSNERNHSSSPPPTSTTTTTSSSSKKRKLADTRPSTSQRRVSFSNAQSVVEVEGVNEVEKHHVWYRHEDYSQFLYSAHRDAQILKHAAQSATSHASLYFFIQNNPDLSPRGLEKVLHHHSSDSDDDSSSDNDSSDSSSEDETSTTTALNLSHSKRIKRQKMRHRQEILSLHRLQKERGSQNPEEIRKCSEDSSRWAVETALKLGHIDANGLI